MNAPLSRTEQIAGVLRDEILRGQYRVGERLPSERELAARFGTSRGTVREALKKLEQIGIAVIHPGGARVAPLEDCTLEVLGPLLDLEDKPDAALVEEVLEMFGMLLGTAAQIALRKASPEEVRRARAIVAELERENTRAEQQRQALRRLGELFIDLADHLVLRLLANGLRMQFMTRLLALGAPPRVDPARLSRAAKALGDALDAADSAAVGEAMRGLNTLLRENARAALAAGRRDKETLSV
jgi:GntR family transcriptional regulator, transcriptional repressor for pyruvate dehydrogenase complex